MYEFMTYSIVIVLKHACKLKRERQEYVYFKQRHLKDDSFWLILFLGTFLILLHIIYQLWFRNGMNITLHLSDLSFDIINHI